jgi:hypothetical protein
MEKDNAENAANRALVVRTGIDPSRLSKTQYTLSLLNEGRRAGLLNDSETDGIRNRLQSVWHNLIRRYTREESSSVAVETAESILASALYALDAYLLSLGDHDQAIACLKNGDIATLHAQGVERVHQIFRETKRLHEEIRRRKLDVPVEAYNLTIEESLPVFLKKYDIVFDAHNTMASIDYPLAVDDMRLQGVFYMKQYLKHLKLENEFCFRFEREDLLRLLQRFGSVCRFDYRIELFNIFELVLQHALFFVMSGGEAHRVTLTVSQFERLERMFVHADASEVDALFRQAMQRLKRDLRIGDPGLSDYMDRCRKALVRRIVHAAEHRHLQAVILTDTEEQIQPAALIFHAGDGMSDVRLRQLLDEIACAETKEEKVRLIRSHFASLHDYLDMLESGCLYGDEYEALYASFGDTELAILAKIVFCEELRGGDMELQTIVSRKNDAESEWTNRLIGFLKGLSAQRIKEIERLIGRIESV